ncbi:4'-phosphopantetheinyl transferase [Kitasatospora herbaricolor]|uniref:4'-phosphopantetheinyl transferase family protein n=1 Tax=Kitasatospora herbaricolor TaxID=68217 RepID=UPI00174A950E|nr:4'-phosphopantetheinyl transferase superfamily protein [Kitasatospora herbaricolor]MDQ0306087.1 4'-phosphopantetheinyl transferase [Kitasatospora herbaricolor]GGV23413.1 4'-phosphopantetheinyl transferase [Kitasatospora herbaricolor]
MTGEPDTVQLWLVPDQEPGPAPAELLAVLDPEERSRAAAYLSADARRRFVLAHGAVRHLVAGRLGVAPQEIRWRRGRHGKPELAGRCTGAEVNLSHSGAVAMVALSASRRVGVDVQRVLPRLDATGMPERYFLPEEARFVRAGADPAARAERFATLWARKEALVKAYGGRLTQGLRIPLLDSGTVTGGHPADAWAHDYRVADVPAPDGYRAAVALSGTGDFRVSMGRWAWPGPASRAPTVPESGVPDLPTT